MRLHDDSVIQLHELYHRKEQDKYIIGSPETGEFMVVTPLEFRVLQLLNTDLTLKHIQELLRGEKEKVDLHSFLVELKEHGFIHKLDNKVIAAKHEPLHEFSFNLNWLGGRFAGLLYLIISLLGIWVLLWKGTIPSYQAFFYQPLLSVMLVFVIVVAWLLVAFRQIVKYAAAKHLGIDARFGFSNKHHLFIPKTYMPKVAEQQEHHVLAMSLLSLTAATSVCLVLATYLSYPYNQLWNLVFAIAFIEIISECLLFLDTDLARFITVNMNIHKLNKQTAAALKEDLKLLWKGGSKQAHPKVTAYAFFYMMSILLALVLLSAYIIPGMLTFLILAFSRFSPDNILFVDSIFALTFFSVDLMLYGFSLLKHHELGHNTLFINTSLIAITVASYIIAAVGVQWFSASNDIVITIVLSYCLGAVIALLFESSVRYAHPFSDQHKLFESIILPVLAACIPISLVFTVSAASIYAFAIATGLGMLTAIVMSHFYRTSSSLDN